MPPRSKPIDLGLKVKTESDNAVALQSSNSSPMALEGVDLSSFGGGFDQEAANTSLNNLPPLPQSPPNSPPRSYHRDPSKNFLSNFKNRTRPDQEPKKAKTEVESTGQGRDAKEEHRPSTSSMSQIYHLRNTPGSTPELSLLLGSKENVRATSTEGNQPHPDLRPQPTPHHSEDSTSSTKRRDKTFRNPLSRQKSLSRDAHSNSISRPTQDPLQQAPPKTAPHQSAWQSDESIVAKKTKDRRGKSAERAPLAGNDVNQTPKTQGKEKSNLKTGSQNVMTKAKTTGGGLLHRLAKIGRSSSNTGREREREVPDSEYRFTTIHLPLAEQTRKTRISKELSKCRDKTEYWMSSLPWRCIDYLNQHCDAEGLYRVPGSGPQVKKWQRTFDTDHDADLLSVEDPLDPNTIASMLKAWLRELPEDMVPDSLQLALAEVLEKENPRFKEPGQSAPQSLRDALSDLPPFNYYLLFAVTCHLSLLLAHKDKNKMDLHNLAVCVNPCLRLERWMFNYLVGDWRNCWQGCYTETEALVTEKRVAQGLDTEPPTTASTTTSEAISFATAPGQLADERAVSSGSSEIPGKPSSDEDTRLRTTSPKARDIVERKAESPQPATYMPSGARAKTTSNTIGLAVDAPETKRPSTAENRSTAIDLSVGFPVLSTGGKAKMAAHNRSQSDLPGSPVSPITNSTADWTFPFRQKT